ncbi:MAG: hypothetical protein H7Z21_12420 [Hymenobacter sp.]|nr:hypothetical protein [Hymenobacter sp.]
MNRLRQLIIVGLAATSLSSCATVFGGPVTTYQKTKPAPGQPQREVRVGALVADILLTGALGTAIDFATGAIYKPQSAAAAPAAAPAK